MAVFFASLNSGSNANCYYAGNEKEGVLIDAGLSCRETEKRMKQLGLSMDMLKAVFISHEHTDHIYGLPGIAKKYRLPVYITSATLGGCDIFIDKQLQRNYTHGKTVAVGDIEVMPFRKSHDASDPHSFMVTSGNVNIGVITDVGFACKRVIRYFSQCHAAFLEANYCDNMLANGEYPFHLKRRISSDRGHLSNSQALELFMNYRSPQLKWLILSHLSQHNNDPYLVESLFSPHAGSTSIAVASRYEASKLFSLDTMTAPVRRSAGRKFVADERQLSLF
jgi:phosphoribosyl 1,2-cyclic phosphodiesterase